MLPNEIIDTPSHVDFVAEVEHSMLVFDSASLVISAHEFARWRVQRFGLKFDPVGR